jgi:uncharacterized surface protein with fasciclin (FAS1) repeats
MMSWPIYRQLAETVKIEWVTEQAAPEIAYHVAWYHQAAAAARAGGAYCIFVPPDVAWSDGTFAHAADVIVAAKLGAAMPYLRVVHETCLPDVASRTDAGSPIAIAPGDLVGLAVRHMHPLSAAVIADGVHSHPSLEVLWRVPGEGLVFRHMARELFLFDPGRIELTRLWYAGEGCTIADIHVVTDSDDMFMLSFAPRLKDIPIYIPRHAVTPMDLARQSLHPLNDNPLTSEFARRAVRLHYGPMTERRWRVPKIRSDGFIKQAIVMREFLRIWRAIQDRGCAHASRLMSVALQATRLARRWPHDGAVTVFIPNDEAMARLGTNLIEPLLAAGAERELERVVLAHTVAGCPALPETGKAALRALDGRKLEYEKTSGARQIGDANIVAAVDVPPHRVFLIDRCLMPEAPQDRDAAPRIG